MLTGNVGCVNVLAEALFFSFFHPRLFWYWAFLVQCLSILCKPSDRHFIFVSVSCPFARTRLPLNCRLHPVHPMDNTLSTCISFPWFSQSWTEPLFGCESRCSSVYPVVCRVSKSLMTLNLFWPISGERNIWQIWFCWYFCSYWSQEHFDMLHDIIGSL